MVTRRPLSLTLVHSPHVDKDYAIFPGSPNIGPIHDFSQVEKILSQMNASVPEEECIDETPIQLKIFSPSVPDLSLIDLPGFIQVVSKAQPPGLREKIRRLCEKYIQEPNIILAVSAADVDLANSEALKESRMVDPTGSRTIGVLTKVDMISPEFAKYLLTDGTSSYPLPMGYIGLSGGRPIHKDIMQNTGNGEDLSFGISALRHRLISGLERALAGCLQGLHAGVTRELQEIDLHFKVLYNDQKVSAEAYMSSLMSLLKRHVDQLNIRLCRAFLAEHLFKALEPRLMALLLDPPLDYHVVSSSEEDEFSLSMVPYQQWQSAISSLTRSHIGKTATALVYEQVMAHMRSLAEMEPFRYHPQFVSSMVQAADSILKTHLPSIGLQLENAVKPYKRGTDFTMAEWIMARNATISMMKEHLSRYERSLVSIQKEIGVKRLKQAIAQVADPSASLSPYLIQKATEAHFIMKKVAILRGRISMTESKESCVKPLSLLSYEKEVSSSSSSSFGSYLWTAVAFWKWGSSSPKDDDLRDSKNYSKKGVPRVSPHFASTNVAMKNLSYDKDIQNMSSSCPIIISQDPCMYECAEVYYRLLLGRLVSTSSLYLHDELTNSFLETFPDALLRDIATNNSKASPSTLPTSSSSQSALASRFTRENPAIDAQIKMQERRHVLGQIKDRLSLYLSQTST